MVAGMSSVPDPELPCRGVGVVTRVYGRVEDAGVLCSVCGKFVGVDSWIRGRLRGGDPLLRSRVGTQYAVPFHVPT